jgi:hypothetical protein
MRVLQAGCRGRFLKACASMKLYVFADLLLVGSVAANGGWKPKSQPQ